MSSNCRSVAGIEVAYRVLAEPKFPVTRSHDVSSSRFGTGATIREALVQGDTLLLRVQLAIHGRTRASLVAGVACPEIGARESFTVVAGDAAPHLVGLEAVGVVRGRLLVESNAIASDGSGRVTRVQTKHCTSP